MPKLESGGSSSFLLDDLRYERGLYTPIYRQIRDASGNIDESLTTVGLANNHNSMMLVNPVVFSKWVDNTDTPYADLSSLMSAFSSIVFTSSSGGGGGIEITQQATNYSALTAGTTVGDLAYVENSQGTAWLPAGMGGTYYPAGWYVWNGTIWVSDRNAIADQLNDLILDKAGVTQTFTLSGLIETPDDKDYKIVVKCPFACTIVNTTTISTSGTCTATFKINTTALGGTANSVSTSEQTQSHASANSVSVGDDIVITVSSNSSCEDMSVTIEYTRDLD